MASSAVSIFLNSDVELQSKRPFYLLVHICSIRAFVKIDRAAEKIQATSN